MVATTQNQTMDAQSKRGLVGGKVNGGEKLYQGNSLIGTIVAYESSTKVGVKIDVQQA